MAPPGPPTGSGSPCQCPPHGPSCHSRVGRSRAPAPVALPPRAAAVAARQQEGHSQPQQAMARARPGLQALRRRQLPPFCWFGTLGVRLWCGTLRGSPCRWVGGGGSLGDAMAGPGVQYDHHTDQTSCTHVHAHAHLWEGALRTTPWASFTTHMYADVHIHPNPPIITRKGPDRPAQRVCDCRGSGVPGWQAGHPVCGDGVQRHVSAPGGMGSVVLGEGHKERRHGLLLRLLVSGLNVLGWGHVCCSGGRGLVCKERACRRLNIGWSHLN